MFGSTSPITGGMKKSTDDTMSLGEGAPAPATGTRTSPRCVRITTASPEVSLIRRAISFQFRTAWPFTAAIVSPGCSSASAGAFGGTRTPPTTRDGMIWSPYVALSVTNTTKASTTFMTTPAIMMKSRCARLFDSNHRCSGISFGPNGFIASGS